MDFASDFAYYNDNEEDAAVEIDDEDMKSSLESSSEALPEPQSIPARLGAILGVGSASSAAVPASSSIPTASSGGFFGKLFGKKEESQDREKVSSPLADMRQAPPAPMPPKPAPAPAPAPAPLIKRKPAVRHRQVVDTNVVALKFGSLRDAAGDVFAGDPVFCGNCKVAFSATSKLGSKPAAAPAPGPGPALPRPPAAPAPTRPPVVAASAGVFGGAIQAGPPGGLEVPKEPQLQQAQALAPPAVAMQIIVSPDEKQHEMDAKDAQTWNCEFCGHSNPGIELEPEEMPTKDSRDYVVDPGAAVEKESKGANDSTVIFVLDISGSMCVTTEVPGNFKLKGMKNPAEFDMPHLDGVPVPQQANSKVTYVSRLQCVCASVDAQLEQWKKDVPDKKVGLITFNREVTIIGDGSGPEEVVAGDKLSNQRQLQDIGKKHVINQPIRETSKTLSDKLFSLSETGPTALGPALLIGIEMASHKPGSTVVVCTDGLANVGIGALDKKDDAEREKVEEWYESMGNLAKLAGVTVSVVSIKGDECALEDLGKVAEATGGTVERVNPMELTKNFGSILANPIIATNVNATFFLHRGLKFRNEDKDTSRLSRDIGNVTEDSEITFEYQFQDRAALDAYKHLPALPFQVHISFTKLDGMKCLRVISKAQPLTNKRDLAEQNVKMDLLAANVSQQSSKLAKKGDYEGARVANRAWGKAMKRSAQSSEQQDIFENWMGQMNAYDANLNVQQQRLESVDSEFTSVRAPAAPAAPSQAAGAGGFAGFSFSAGPSSSASSSSASSKPTISKVARQIRKDEDYAEMNKMSSVSSKAFKK